MLNGRLYLTEDEFFPPNSRNRDKYLMLLYSIDRHEHFEMLRFLWWKNTKSRARVDVEKREYRI